MQILADPAAERAVLAGIGKFGADAYFDVADILSSATFTIDSNQIIFHCVKTILEDDNNAIIDIPSIHSVARGLGYEHVFKKTEEAKHLQAVMNMSVMLPNVRKFAGTIRKLEIARLLHSTVGNIQEKLLEVTGKESIEHILGIAEEPIFDFSSLLNTVNNDGPKPITQGLVEHLQYLADNPVEQMGISTGYPVYDMSIGGGLRNGTVNMIAARPKVGKSLLASNISTFISRKLKIPVLYLDTEMMRFDQVHRMMANLCSVEIDNIETGKFGRNMNSYRVIMEMAKQLEAEEMFDHMNISGTPFDEITSIMRRWVMKRVGLNDDGSAKPCVIVYDYLKMVSSEGLSADMKEYQALGFMMTALHNFSVRYKLPILSFVQLNRDGITKETTDAVAGSDRVIWLCSNFSIYKTKSDEEIAEGDRDDGNRKLVPIVARHGGGLNDGDYINMQMIGKYGRIVEGKTYYESNKEDGIVIDHDNPDEEIPFD